MALLMQHALVEIRVLLWSNDELGLPVQSLDTAHHMHFLLLSHGNEWSISFGRDQGAPMANVSCPS